MDRLGELRTLVAIVDTGSLAAAARRLGRSPPSITRDLADLERRVGVSLVERSTRNCRLTPAGTRLAEHGRQLLSGYEEAIAEAAGEAAAPRGLIRMTAPITFGGDYVAPLVTGFMDAHAEIAIDLQLFDRVVDLAGEEFNLAVRIGRLSDSSLIARTVGELRRVVVASPAYLGSNGTPHRPQDLIEHEVIQHDSRGANAPWTFRGEDGRPISVAVTARLTVNQPGTAVAAARDGRGIVQALSHQVDADLRAGGLVRILRDFEPDALPVSLVWPSSRRSWRRIRLLVDHLAKGLSALELLQRLP
jgi:DNA-binding transcriptional LysR family regulator